jgi:hypothetical protein
MSTEALIFRMGEEGKNAQAIAEELNARGLRGRAGRVFSAADVEGFLRFIGGTGIEVKEPTKISQAAWGRGRTAIAQAYESPPETPSKRRRKKWNAGGLFTEAQKAEIARLYQQEAISAGEIAIRLNLPYRRVNPYCAHLAGFSVPPGEITEYIDAEGRTVMKCPPAFARGAHPQRNVRPTQGGW